MVNSEDQYKENRDGKNKRKRKQRKKLEGRERRGIKRKN